MQAASCFQYLSGIDSSLIGAAASTDIILNFPTGVRIVGGNKGELFGDPADKLVGGINGNIISYFQEADATFETTGSLVRLAVINESGAEIDPSDITIESVVIGETDLPVLDETQQLLILSLILTMILNTERDQQRGLN